MDRPASGSLAGPISMYREPARLLDATPSGERLNECAADVLKRSSKIARHSSGARHCHALPATLTSKEPFAARDSSSTR